MSYKVFARKWRPHSFSDFVGQKHALQGLMYSLDNDKLHHAYLFSGTRGVGKTTLARILSACFSCEKGVSSNPCGKCNNCIEIREGNFIDLVEIDAASQTKVEDTRDLLDTTAYAPTNGRFRIYLIDEVHMLSRHSFNAMLKTLEEPPAHVKFLLATTDPQKLPVTVLSRCLQFHLRHLSVDEIEEKLTQILNSEKIEFTKSALQLVVKSAKGSLRDALSLLEQAIASGAGKLSDVATSSLLGLANSVDIQNAMSALIANKIEDLLQFSKTLEIKNIDYQYVVDELANLLYRMALYKQYPKVQVSDESNEKVAELASGLSKEEIQLWYQMCITAKKDIAAAPLPKIGFEMLLLRLIAFCPFVNSQDNVYPQVNKTVSLQKKR